MPQTYSKVLHRFLCAAHPFFPVWTDRHVQVGGRPFGRVHLTRTVHFWICLSAMLIPQVRYAWGNWRSDLGVSEHVSWWLECVGWWSSSSHRNRLSCRSCRKDLVLNGGIRHFNQMCEKETSQASENTRFQRVDVFVCLRVLYDAEKVRSSTKILSTDLNDERSRVSSLRCREPLFVVLWRSLVWMVSRGLTDMNWIQHALPWCYFFGCFVQGDLDVLLSQWCEGVGGEGMKWTQKRKSNETIKFSQRKPAPLTRISIPSFGII